MLGLTGPLDHDGPRPEGHGEMGIFDRFRHHKDDAAGTATALKDRAAGMMSEHGEKVGQGLDKAGQMVDEKTGGKYGDQIGTGVQKAKDMLGQKTGQASNAADDTATDMPIPDAGTQGGEGTARPPQN
jgi:MT0933-like antitoxin protein